MIRVSVIHKKESPEVILQIHDTSQKNGNISVKLPIRVIGKLSAMLGRIQETKSYQGEITIKDGKVFSTENIEKEIT